MLLRVPNNQIGVALSHYSLGSRGAKPENLGCACVLDGGSETAAYRCSRVIHQSARGEPRPGSSSSPRQIVNNSAAPAAAQRWSRGKLSNGHAAPGHESPPLSSNDYKETFGPGASSRSFDEYSDDNRRRFSVSISRGSSGAPWEKSPSN